MRGTDPPAAPSLFPPSVPRSLAEAQRDMIDESLAFAGVTAAKSMVDVGCGVGGSSRHISRKFGCSAKGITLSPYQAQRANNISAEEGLGDKCSFQVRPSRCRVPRGLECYALKGRPRLGGVRRLGMVERNRPTALGRGFMRLPLVACRWLMR